MYRGAWNLATPPAGEPVSVDQLKDQLRVDSDAERIYLSGLITAARQYLEDLTWRAWLTQTWTLTLDTWGDAIHLPRPPLASVTSVQYVDTAGATQTLAADQYTALTHEEPGRIVPAYSVTWPSLRAAPAAVTVTYAAGYGDDPGDVPAPLRHALQLLAAQWYEHREPVVTGAVVSPLPYAVDALLAPYRVRGF